MITEEEVINYLKNNSQLLIESEEILTLLDIDASSPFHQRQLEVLKQRDKKQTEKIRSMVGNADHNQGLEDNLLAIATILLGSQTQAAPLGFVATAIENQLAIDKVVLLREPEQDNSNYSQYQELQQRVAHKNSVCDDRVSNQVREFLFGEESLLINSCAFMPLLHQSQLVGVGVLAAYDTARFSPEDGVLYLNKLGRLVGSYLVGAE